MEEVQNMFLELKRGMAAPPPLPPSLEDLDLSSAAEKAKADAIAGETPEKEGDPTKIKMGPHLHKILMEPECTTVYLRLNLLIHLSLIII